jgi:hypothetical protein
LGGQRISKPRDNNKKAGVPAGGETFGSICALALYRIELTIRELKFASIFMRQLNSIKKEPDKYI